MSGDVGKMERGEKEEYFELNCDLIDLLTDFGSTGAHEDFSVHTDYLYSYQQAVFVHKAKFLTPSVLLQVQRMLKQEYERWCVTFVLPSAGEGAPDSGEEPSNEIDVTASGFRERWDKAYLAQRFGEDFHFSGPNWHLGGH